MQFIARRALAVILLVLARGIRRRSCAGTSFYEHIVQMLSGAKAD